MDIMGSRNKEIQRMWENGETFEAIAQRYNLSVTRVRQICDQLKEREREREKYGKLTSLPRRVFARIKYGTEIESYDDLLSALENGIQIRGVGIQGTEILEKFVGFPLEFDNGTIRKRRSPMKPPYLYPCEIRRELTRIDKEVAKIHTEMAKLEMRLAELNRQRRELYDSVKRTAK